MGIKTLVVGDPHLQFQKLDDGRKFIEKLYDLSIDHEMVVILGDLFHNFAILRSEVLSLWNEFFHHVHNKTQVVAMVGNHDYSGQSGGNHALEVFKDRINVADSKTPSCLNGVYFLPFFRDKTEFESAASKCPKDSVLFCHQSFTGADLGNGYYDPEGASPDSVRHLGAVIAGHVHTGQTLGNIWYPGTPFQHNFGESGQEKNIYSIHLSQTGYTLIKGYNLGMPRFEILQPKDSSKSLVEGLLDVLPKPDPIVSYRISGRGTPQEIADFWKTNEARIFRAGARRVVDALIPERGAGLLPGSHGKTKREKLELFIRNKKWRTPESQLCDKAVSLAFGRVLVG